MSRPKILFWLNGSRGTAGRHMITCRITFNGRANISVGEIEPERWDSERKRVKGEKRDAWRLNKKIVQMENDLMDVIDNHTPVSAEGIKKAYKGEEDVVVSNKSVREVFREALPLWDIQESTVRGHNRAHSLFETFCTSEDNTSSMLISDVTSMTFKRFEYFLNTYNDTAKEEDMLNPSSILVYLSKIKRVFTHALEAGYLEKDPLSFYIPEMTKKRLILLDNLDRRVSKDDLHKWETTYIPFHHLEEARQCFLWQVYSGMSYIDASNVKSFSDLPSKDIKGRTNIYYKRHKTNKLAIVPVLDKLRAFLYVHGETLSFPQEGTYRDRLKKAAEFLGVEYVGSHGGRHVFGSEMLEKGFSMEAVSRMMGHGSINMTEKTYAKVNVDKIYSDINRLNEAI